MADSIFLQETKRKLTVRTYQAAIPACCEYQTMQDHADHLALCWGLVRATERGRPMDCSGCELATRPVFFRRETPK